MASGCSRPTRITSGGRNSGWPSPHRGRRRRRSVRCGFRDFRFEDGHFRLNGRRIYLRCSHTGNCCPVGLELPVDPDWLRRDLINAKMMRFNAIRFIAGVAKRYQLDVAGEIGLMVYEEAYASWCLADSPRMAERYDESLLGVVRRDCNHPSVVIWGLLNERLFRVLCGCPQALVVGPTLVDAAGAVRRSAWAPPSRAARFLQRKGRPKGALGRTVHPCRNPRRGQLSLREAPPSGASVGETRRNPGLPSVALGYGWVAHLVGCASQVPPSLEVALLMQKSQTPRRYFPGANLARRKDLRHSGRPRAALWRWLLAQASAPVAGNIGHRHHSPRYGCNSMKLNISSWPTGPPGSAPLAQSEMLNRAVWPLARKTLWW